MKKKKNKSYCLDQQSADSSDVTASTIERDNEQLMPVHPSHATPHILWLYHISPQLLVCQPEVS